MAKLKSRELNKEAMPDFVPPMLATLTDHPFDSPDWVFEIKWDGYRTLAFINHNHVNLLSRNNLSFNELFRPIQKALMFSGFECILDGEIVILNEQGRPDIHLIQNYGQTRKGTLVYFIFDILWFNGNSTETLPLLTRKKILAAIPLAKVDCLQICKHSLGNGIELFNTARQMNLEGIIAKKANSKYVSGRSADWLKIKNTNNCEAVILGYTTSARKMYFASLLLGHFKEGKMIYVGQVDTGFSNFNAKELFEKFQPIIISSALTSDVPVKYLKNVVWLRPVLVCRIRYGEITAEGKVRHCNFQSLIEKKATDVTAIR